MSNNSSIEKNDDEDDDEEDDEKRWPGIFYGNGTFHSPYFKADYKSKGNSN